MQQVHIHLSSTAQIQHFAKILTTLSGDFEVISGNHLLDARSLMGLFSLNLTQPITLKVYNDCPENLSALDVFMSKTEEHNHE